MKQNELAAFGGPITINRKLTKYQSIGSEEKSAAMRVMDSGILSAYIASFTDNFLGGETVQNLEKRSEEVFKVKHCIAVNSWTSGLICAVGALDVQPGDEIVVTPWTMSATVAAILHWGCIPVFADIDLNNFMMLPESIEKNITDRTKAIMVADICGQSADYAPIRAIAKKHNLKIISDTAQAPYAKTPEGLAGTLGDIGGISLNYHKHIHCGEGGIIFTNNDELAMRMRLIRNHAEACMQESGLKNLGNMVGYNFRLGEIESAIALEQLKKLPKIVKNRQYIANRLSNAVNSLDGLYVPDPIDQHEHVYYVLPIIFDQSKFSISRKEFVNYLEAEGALGFGEGYSNCHRLPALENKVAYGNSGFPWSLNPDVKYHYGKGVCPNAELLQDSTFFFFEMCMFELPDEEIDLIISAINKVHAVCVI